MNETGSQFASASASLPSWLTWGFLVLGMYLITLGLLFRMGRARVLARYYDEPFLPFFTRNMAFFNIPGGLVLLFWFLAALLSNTGETLTVLFLLLSFLSLGTGIWFLRTPPNWLKPHWLREVEERKRRKGVTTQSSVTWNQGTFRDLR
jgi:hypothetical protein